LIGKFGGVLQNEDEPVKGSHTRLSCLKMPGENLTLVDRAVRQKAVRRLGIGPVLTSHRNRRADRTCHLLKHRAKPFAQPLITKGAGINFSISPSGRIENRISHLAPPLQRNGAWG